MSFEKYYRLEYQGDVVYSGFGRRYSVGLQISIRRSDLLGRLTLRVRKEFRKIDKVKSAASPVGGYGGVAVTLKRCLNPSLLGVKESYFGLTGLTIQDLTNAGIEP